MPKWEIMNFNRAHFDKLSLPIQALIFIALPAPLFAVFSIAGDLPRGALTWAFSTALLNAIYAFKERKAFSGLGLPTAVLVALHVSLVIWNPLRHAPLLGGLFLPICLVDYCVDYAFLWSSLHFFKNE